jgi:hypothetical protein
MPRTSDLDREHPKLNLFLMSELGAGKTTLMSQFSEVCENVAWAITDPNTLPTLLALGIDVEYETFIDTDLRAPQAFSRLVEWTGRVFTEWDRDEKLNTKSAFIVDSITGLLPIVMNHTLKISGHLPEAPRPGAPVDKASPMGYYGQSSSGSNSVTVLKSISNLGDYNVMGSLVKHYLNHICCQSCHVGMTAHINKTTDKLGNQTEVLQVNPALQQEAPSRFNEAWVLRVEEIDGKAVRVVDTQALVSRTARTCYEHILAKREKAYLPYLLTKIYKGLKERGPDELKNRFDPGEVEIDQEKNFNAPTQRGWSLK